MKAFSKFLLVPTAGVFLLSACLSRNLAEPDPKVEPDPTAITVEAEFSTDTDSVKVVHIKSNRSWYLHLNDGTLDPKKQEDTLDWVYSTVKEHVNMTKVSDDVEIPVIFRRNKSDKARESTLDIWSCGEKIKQVKFVQKGAVYHLNATADKTDVTCDADTAVVHIDCNTYWTARIVEADAAVTLNATEGFDPYDLRVQFDYNMDPQKTKTAKVEIAAQGCEPKDFIFTQGKAVPYLRLSVKNTGRVPAGNEFALVEVETNITDITAEAVGGDMTVTSFERVDMRNFKVYFTNTKDDPHIYGTATVKFTPNGVNNVAPVEYTFKQPGALTWMFYTGTAGSLKVFGLPMSKPSTAVNPSKAMDPLETSTGDKYVLYHYGSVYGRDNTGSSGVVINTSGRILFPAIEGYVLKAVRIEYRQHSSFPGTKDRIAGAKDLSFNDADKTATYSVAGEYYTGIFDQSKFPTGSTIHTYVLGQDNETAAGGDKPALSQPEAGKNYLLNHTSRNCIMRNITLFYDPAEDQNK